MLLVKCLYYNIVRYFLRNMSTVLYYQKQGKTFDDYFWLGMSLSFDNFLIKTMNLLTLFLLKNLVV